MNRRGWIASTIAAVVCVALLVTGMVLRNPATTAPGSTAPRSAGTTVTPGAGTPGLGDTYYPDAGNGGYEVDHYAIDVRWDQAAGSFTGTTTMTANATSALSSFYIDYYGTVTGVQVNGEPAAHARANRTNVWIDAHVERGPFTLTLQHRSKVREDCGRAAIEQTVGVIVAREP